MMTRFLFYDIETSGLSPAFDQVLTFACIQTDSGLTETSREVITVKLRPDIVPSPGAFLTHCLTPETLDSGIPEYHAALKIHQLFNTPDTVSLGYNSLGFDDEFLRFTFYRNLLDPYSHQYANGCGRMDLLPVAVIYRLFCQHILSWPVLENGKSTLKLEHISRENKFEVSGRAHEAMADVEALLSMARIFHTEKKIWDYVLGFFDKTTDGQRIQGLNTQNAAVDTDLRIGIMVNVAFGADCNYIAPVLHLGASEPYKNQSLWLRLDRPGVLDTFDQENDIYDVFVIRKRFGDQLFILPCFERFWAKLAPEAVRICLENIECIQKNHGQFAKTAAYHRSFKYPNVPDVDPDADLYQGGFFSPSEKRDIRLLHQSLSQGGGDDLYEMCNAFSTERLRALAGRILVRSFGGAAHKDPGFARHLKGVSGVNESIFVKGYKNDKKYTCVQALAELSDIETAVASGDSAPLDARQTALMEWLNAYINDMSTFLAGPL